MSKIHFGAKSSASSSFSATAAFCLACAAVSSAYGAGDSSPNPVVSCPDGKVLDAADNSCRIPDYWSQVPGHVHASGSESPLQKAFGVARLTVRADRSADAILLYSGKKRDYKSVEDFLSGLGIPSDRYTKSVYWKFKYRKDVSRVFHSRNLDFLHDRQLLALSNFQVPFVTDAAYAAAPYKMDAGVSTQSVRDRAWMLVNTGSGGNQDSLRGLGKHHAGTTAAAATGKVHFYYSLDASLTVRHADANGCKHISSHCIGVPHSFQVKIRGPKKNRDAGPTITMAGDPVNFAFAAYLTAWERMPAATHISAVFEMARGCVADIGTAGVDDDTGLGRLDIGCLAYEAAQAAECVPGKELVGRATCALPDYWNAIRTHGQYDASDNRASPHQQAFAYAQIKDRQVDRSADAYVMDTTDHGLAIRNLLAGIGLAATTNYTYVELVRRVRGASLRSIQDNYFSLSSSDFVSLSYQYPDFSQQVLGSGAWVIISAGNDGQDWAFGISAPPRQPIYDAVNNSGKVHVFYGLDASVAARHYRSDGCQYVENVCIGAPYTFDVNGRSISGTSFSAPFGFAAYLMAWERMAANTHISAVFDMALDCVDDIGAAGPDADTGMGRLDIGCLAHGAANAPECHPGYVLVSVSPVSCERFSYWDDLRQPLAFGGVDGESVIERAFRDVNLQARVTDRSGRAHMIADDSSRTFLRTAGITATVNYRYIPSSADVVSEYGKLTSSDLFAMLHQPISGVFTSNKVKTAGIEGSDVAGGAWIIAPVGGQSRSTTVTLAGEVNSLSRLDKRRRQGTKAAAATGKVHFLYSLNEDLNGRNAISDGCANIKDHCIGVPHRYIHRTVSVSTVTITQFLNYYTGAHFGFAAYLTAWERLPQTVSVSDLFGIAKGCVEDIGQKGADNQTGLGRLDIGCLAFEAYKKSNPVAVLSTATVVAQARGVNGFNAYMDDFTQGMFGDQLGYLNLPGPTAAGVQIGFAGDSFQGVYRPALSAAGSYAGEEFHPLHVPLSPGFGIVASGSQAGAYYQVARGLRAGLLAGRKDSFFGNGGSGEFAFDCTTDVRLAVSADLHADEDSALGLTSWVQSSRAGCIRGQLLDRLQGSEAGLSAFYTRSVGDWQLQAQAWGSRFVGGEVELAGQRFDIGSGSTSYGGRIRMSYSF